MIAALRIAGVKPETLAVGGAFTAVVLGLAAQQTLAHVFAGLVLLTTRPFVVGERVKLRGGSMAGEIEGIVSSLGLFYTTLVTGGDRTMIPNNVLMQLAVIPISEPERVELRARFNADVTPQKLQRMIEKAVTIPLRSQPQVRLEELDGDEITVAITAVPLNPADGAKLASDVLDAVRDSDLDGKPDAYDLPTPTAEQDTSSGQLGAALGRLRRSRAGDPDPGGRGGAREGEVRRGGPARDAVAADESGVNAAASTASTAAREEHRPAQLRRDRRAPERPYSPSAMSRPPASLASATVAAVGLARSRGPSGPGGSERPRRRRSRFARWRSPSHRAWRGHQVSPSPSHRCEGI